MHRAPARWPWILWCTVGLAAWIGATVVAAATASPPDAAERVLRTFAGGGAAFLAVTFAGAAVGIGRRNRGPGGALARTRRLAYLYVGFGVVTSALALVAIGSGDDRVARPLSSIALGVVVAWAVVAQRALASFRA